MSTAAQQRAPFSCPNCGAPYNLPVLSREKTYRCASCRQVFTVAAGGRGEARAVPVTAPAAGPAQTGPSVGGLWFVANLVQSAAVVEIGFGVLFMWFLFDQGAFLSIESLLILMACAGCLWLLGCLNPGADGFKLKVAAVVGLGCLTVVFCVGAALKAPAEKKVAAEVAEPRARVEAPVARAPAFTTADSRARQDRWIANLPMSGAIEIHRIVDQTMMGSRDNYRVILVDPTAWKAQDYDLRVDAIANLMRARARRFGYADIEVRDGYTDELLGGWRDNHGVYIVGEAP